MAHRCLSLEQQLGAMTAPPVMFGVKTGGAVMAATKLLLKTGPTLAVHLRITPKGVELSGKLVIFLNV